MLARTSKPVLIKRLEDFNQEQDLQSRTSSEVKLNNNEEKRDEDENGTSIQSAAVTTGADTTLANTL